MQLNLVLRAAYILQRDYVSLFFQYAYVMFLQVWPVTQGFTHTSQLSYAPIEEIRCMLADCVLSAVNSEGLEWCSSPCPPRPIEKYMPKATAIWSLLSIQWRVSAFFSMSKRWDYPDGPPSPSGSVVQLRVQHLQREVGATG